MKAILFDMDGVLIDSFEAWFRLFNSTLKKYGKEEVTKDQFIARAWARDMNKVAAEFFPGEDVPKIISYYFSNFLNFKEYLKLMPEAEKILGLIKERGLKMGVVSNTFNELTCKLLDYLGIIGYFDVVVGGDDVKNGKPSPDAVLLGCEKLGVNPRETFMVGDTVYDIEAGREAGCVTVGFSIAGGDEEIDNLRGLLELI